MTYNLSLVIFQVSPMISPTIKKFCYYEISFVPLKWTKPEGIQKSWTFLAQITFVTVNEMPC